MLGHSSLSRRDWLRLAAVGAVGVSQSGWLRALAADAAVNPTRWKSVIMLWLNGGPATIDLWDLKPGHANGGPFKAIETALAGVKISEHLPKLAKRMDEMAVIRSMATREGDHRRARIVGLTGYTPVGAIQFPSVGSLIAHELDDPGTDLPGFVSIGGRSGTDLGAGFLGPRFSPLVVGGGDRRSDSRARRKRPEGAGPGSAGGPERRSAREAARTVRRAGAAASRRAGRDPSPRR